MSPSRYLIGVLLCSLVGLSACQGQGTQENQGAEAEEKAASTPATKTATKTVATLAELQQAVELATPGDVVAVAAGTFSDIGILTLANSGTAEQTITLRAETPGQTILTGESGISITGDYWLVEGFEFRDARFPTESPNFIFAIKGGSNNRVTNCAFVRCGVPDRKYMPMFTLTDGARDNRVDHCTIADFFSMGLTVRVGPEESDTVVGTRIDHNHFRDVQRHHKNGGECVQLGQNATAYGRMVPCAVVEFNLFEKADGDDETISNKSSGNIIRHNTFRDCGGGIWLRGGRGVSVHGNTIIRCPVGITVYGADHRIFNNTIEETHSFAVLLQNGSDWQNVEPGKSFEAANGCIIAHNTIVNSTVRGLFVGDFRKGNPRNAHRTEPPTGNRIANNIITSEKGFLFREVDAPENTFVGNILHVEGEATYTSEEDADEEREGFRRVDPILAMKDDRFALAAADSPAVDAAAPLPDFTVTVDIDGETRSKPDIGADEFSEAPTPAEYRPLTAADVGASWLRQ